MSGSVRPSAPTTSQRPPEAIATRRFHLLPLVLLILAVLDLRTELRLLFDHLTVTALLTAITAHPLAIAVLLAQPSLWGRYRSVRH